MAPTASFFAEDGSLLMGYPDSPKRAGGLWLLVTFIGVCIGLIGLVSNILFLGDYKDDRTLYTDDKWDRPMSVSRDLYVHGFFARGVVYYFIGVMTYDEDKNGAKFEDHEYNRVCTLAIMSLGAFYILAAFILDLSPHCLKGLLNAQGIQDRPETPFEL